MLPVLNKQYSAWLNRFIFGFPVRTPNTLQLYGEFEYNRSMGDQLYEVRMVVWLNAAGLCFPVVSPVGRFRRTYIETGGAMCLCCIPSHTTW